MSKLLHIIVVPLLDDLGIFFSVLECIKIDDIYLEVFSEVWEVVVGAI